MFNPGWRERRGLDYSVLEIPETGERLTQNRFNELHASQNPQVILIHTNPDDVVDAAIRAPQTMIASDGIKEHPRNAGTFARVLARYVRTQHSLTLMDRSGKCR